jgi:hypothetical protein
MLDSAGRRATSMKPGGSSKAGNKRATQDLEKLDTDPFFKK